MSVATNIKKNKVTGFTIVELLVTIAIIGILSVISVVSFSRVQSQSRDSQRSSKITVIAEALEKYYEKNGEYPSCVNMSQSAATISSSTLTGMDPKALATPSATTGSNSILPSCANLVAGSTTDAFAYIGDSSAGCLTGVDCTRYTLKYREESTGNIITIASRRNNDSINAPVAIATVNSSTQITVAWNSVLRASTYNIEMAQNSSFTGSSFTNDLTSTSNVFTGLSQGQKYYFRVYAASNSIPGLASAATDAITNIATPTAPTATAATVGATTTYTWGSTCPAGTIARYQYTYYTSTGYNSGWVVNTTPGSFAATTSPEGYTYSLIAHTQCYTAFATSPGWGASSNVAFYYRPMTTQAAPVITATLSGANVLATISPAVTCTSGTIQYGIRSRTNDGTWTAYSAWATTTTATQVANDGVKYGYQAQDRCYIDATNAPSATVAGVEDTYIEPIATPTAPTVAAATAGATTTYTWGSTCPAGTTASYQYTYYTSTGYNSGWYSTASTSFAATTSLEGYTYSLIAHTQCYTAFATSAGWGASSNVAAYYRPITAPAVPTLTATAAGPVINSISNSGINLSWNSVAGATSYLLQRSSNSSFTDAVTIANQSGTTFFSNGLSFLTTYYYRVRAVNAGGSSNWSNTASATTSSTNAILTGQTITTGQYLVDVVNNNTYSVQMQGDGNSVVYGGVIWSTATNTASPSLPYKLIMQGDCNLVLYNNAGTALWNSVTSGGGSNCYAVIQADGNFVVYTGDNVAKWSSKGSQMVKTWATTNLNVGTMITGATTQTNNGILEKYCYNNLASNCTTYGGLYQWNEAMQYVTTNGAQGICPAGSHIPTNAEWTALETYLGSATAGTKVKPGGSSGLNMPLAGYRNADGLFYILSTDAGLWTSTDSGAGAWQRNLNSDYPGIGGPNSVGKNNGFSVRCKNN